MTTFKRARTHCCVREKRHKEKVSVSHAEGRVFLGAIRSPSFPKLNRGTAEEEDDDKRATEELSASNDDSDDEPGESRGGAHRQGGL